MSILQQLSDELLQMLDSELTEEQVLKATPNVFEWITEMGRFKFDSFSQTLYIEPNNVIQNIDLRITILPTGASIDNY